MNIFWLDDRPAGVGSSASGRSVRADYPTGMAEFHEFGNMRLPWH